MNTNRSGPGWVMLCGICLAAVFAAGVFSFSFSAARSAVASPGISSSKGGSSIAGTPLSSSKSGSSSAPAATHASNLVQGQELRAVWVATVYDIDFPSKAGLSAGEQKSQADTLLDNVKKWGMNTVFFQVRGNADALYKSSIYPWSSVLTGKQGADPGYDPLSYFVEGAHKRGLKLVAWVNPYRVSSSSDTSGFAASNPAKLHADWVVKTSDGQLYFDPGQPQARQMIEDGIVEIVKNYAVDGIVFDDYFYPEKDFGDKTTWQKYSAGVQIEDWRRNNVTALISELHDKIKSTKSSVSFGISPFAVWANKSTNPEGSDTSAGVQSYYDQYADTRLWVQKKYVDFINPQIYWSIGFDKAPYEKVLDWWAKTVDGTGVELYVAHTISKVGGSEAGWNDPEQITKQLGLAMGYPEYKGSSFYSYSKLLKNSLSVQTSLTGYYAKAQPTGK